MNYEMSSEEKILCDALKSKLGKLQDDIRKVVGKPIAKQAGQVDYIILAGDTCSIITGEHFTRKSMEALKINDYKLTRPVFSVKKEVIERALKDELALRLKPVQPEHWGDKLQKFEEKILGSLRSLYSEDAEKFLTVHFDSENSLYTIIADKELSQKPFEALGLKPEQDPAATTPGTGDFVRSEVDGMAMFKVKSHALNAKILDKQQPGWRANRP